MDQINRLWMRFAQAQQEKDMAIQAEMSRYAETGGENCCLDLWFLSILKDLHHLSVVARGPLMANTEL